MNKRMAVPTEIWTRIAGFQSFSERRSIERRSERALIWSERERKFALIFALNMESYLEKMSL